MLGGFVSVDSGESFARSVAWPTTEQSTRTKKNTRRFLLFLPLERPTIFTWSLFFIPNGFLLLELFQEFVDLRGLFAVQLDSLFRKIDRLIQISTEMFQMSQ